MPNKEILELMDVLYDQARIRFGSAIKGRWFYDGDCPGCLRKISAMKWKGKESLSLNSFIFREHGVLIIYLLCGKCAKKIFRASEKDPNAPTPVHTEIEKNLKQGFVKQLGH